jgi:hypothetical protein
MYLSPQMIKKILIGILIAIVAGLLIWGVVFVFTHGRISIEGEDISKATVARINTDTVSSVAIEENGSAFVESGEYAVRIESTSGQRYSVNVEVESFLRTTTVKPSFVDQNSARKIAVNTLQRVVPVNGKRTVSFNDDNYNQSLISHKSNDPFGDNNAVDENAFGTTALYSKNPFKNQILGLGVVEFEHGAISLAPMVYSLASKTLKNIPYPDGELSYSLNPDIITPNNQDDNHFAITPGQESQKIYVYTDPGKQPRIITLSEPAAYSDSSPLISISGNKLAVLSGTGYTSPLADPDEEHLHELEETETRNTLYIYDLTNGQQVNKVDLDSSLRPVSIALSPSGTYLSVTDEQFLTVVSVGDGGSAVYSEPFEFASTVVWQDNEQFLYSTPTGGLYRVNVTEKTSTLAFGNETLGINWFYLDGQSVYFSAYSKRSQDNTPDGYILDLANTDPQNNGQFSHLPHDTDEYKISIVNSTIFIKPRVIVGSSGLGAATQQEIDTKVQSARNYLSENISNLDEYTIVVDRP